MERLSAHGLGAILILLCLSSCQVFLSSEERQAFEDYYKGNFIATTNEEGVGGRYFSRNGDFLSYFESHDGDFVVVGKGSWRVAATSFNGADLWIDADYQSLPPLAFFRQQHTFKLAWRDDGGVDAFKNPLPFLKGPSRLLLANPVPGFPFESQFNAAVRKMGADAWTLGPNAPGGPPRD